MINQVSGALLKIDGMKKAFGGLMAVGGISFEIAGKEILGIIGPNGSGKSTLVNLISGIYEPTGGTVHLKGHKITGQRPHRIFQLGLSRTFQNTRLFRGLTVTQNMMIGAWSHHLTEKEAMEQLDKVGILDLRDHLAGNLSYGDQKLLDLGMSLIGSPSIVVLDEPLAGVHTSLIDRIMKIIRHEYQEKGTTFIIVEHNVPFIMKMCERILVINQGQLLSEGTPEKIRSDKSVISAYLGSENF